MSTQAVMRALRKNKTIRYGVPMLVSAGTKTCGAGFRKGWVRIPKGVEPRGGQDPGCEGL